MKNKIALLFIGFILSVVMIFGTIGCDTDPAIAQNQAVISALQTDITAAKADIATLKTSIAGIQMPSLTGINSSISTIDSQLTTVGTRLTALETSLNTYAKTSDLNIVTSDLASLANSVNGVRTQLDGLAVTVTNLSNAIAILQWEIGTVDLTEIEDYIVDLLERVSDLEDESIDITQFNNKLDTLADNDLYLQGRIDTLQTIIQQEKAEITRFEQSSSWMSFRVNEAGNFVVILTLYGENLTGVTAVPISSSNVWVLSTKIYGGNNSMMVIIYEPNHTGTPSINANWTANKTVELTLTNEAAIFYASITTGVR